MSDSSFDSSSPKDLPSRRNYINVWNKFRILPPPKKKKREKTHILEFHVKVQQYIIFYEYICPDIYKVKGWWWAMFFEWLVDIFPFIDCSQTTLISLRRHFLNPISANRVVYNLRTLVNSFIMYPNTKNYTSAPCRCFGIVYIST